MAKRKEKRGFRLIISQTRRRGPKNRDLNIDTGTERTAKRRTPPNEFEFWNFFVSYFHFHDTVYLSRSQPNPTERNCNILNHGEKNPARRGKNGPGGQKKEGDVGGANQHLSRRRGTTSTTKSTTAITKSISGRFQHNPPHKNRGASGSCAWG